MMASRYGLGILLLGFLMLVGCGQKGDLYLPEQGADRTSAPANHG